jgi:hypothetical protein
MRRTVRIIGIIGIVAGVFSIVAGGITYYVVRRELSDQNITVSEDAKNFAGEKVTGPFTAYAQAMAIKEHSIKAGDGKTYAELPQDDPARQTVMTADFLQASLFTSVVAFGVAVLVMGLGLMMILFGVAFLVIPMAPKPATAEAAETGPPPVEPEPEPEPSPEPTPAPAP